MVSSTKSARLLVIFQIALFVISAVIISGSVCHGARDDGTYAGATTGRGSIGIHNPPRP
ncbi:unnamed protein product [Urochloa humidicola]